MKLVKIDQQLWLNVEPLFHSGWHETVDRESWRLSKYSVIHLIIIFFTRRDKKQVKKKQTKKKGELGDKPVKVKRLIKGFKSLFLQQVKCSLFSCTVCTCYSPFLNGELKFLATQNRASFQVGLLFFSEHFSSVYVLLIFVLTIIKGCLHPLLCLSGHLRSIQSFPFVFLCTREAQLH